MGDSVHVATTISQPSVYSWNIFRYVGDYLHLLGVFVLFITIFKNQGVKGISKKTQILYFLVFFTRYLDLFEHSQTAYLVFFKLTYMITSVLVLFLFVKLDPSYERSNDTFRLSVVVLPCVAASVFLTKDYSTLEILWTFSEFIEGFAMVPQYVFCYREKGQHDWGTSLYVISTGGYRMFYALNWIYKKIQVPKYSDIQSWIGGLIDILFFVDFLAYRFTGNSGLRTIVLSVDTKINEISDKVEQKVLGASSSQHMNLDGGSIRRRHNAAVGEDLGIELL